jgi:hypothetical protein
VISKREWFIQDLKSKYKSFLNQDDSNYCLKIFLSHGHLLNLNTNIYLTHNKRGSYLIHTDNFNGKIDLIKNEARVKMQANEYIFDSFLRILYSVILLSNEGFLIHSAGLERQGKGYLLPGASSSGKSTIARKAKDFRILSDELVVVRRIENSFYLFATPFIGEFNAEAANICVPLEKIFFLNRGLSFAYQRQTQLETMINLLGNVFFFTRDLQSNQEILNLCYDLSSEVTAFQINPVSFYEVSSLYREEFAVNGKVLKGAG